MHTLVLILCGLVGVIAGWGIIVAVLGPKRDPEGEAFLKFDRERDLK